MTAPTDVTTGQPSPTRPDGGTFPVGWRAGTVTREGAVVGAWFVTDAKPARRGAGGRPFVTLKGALRTADGRALAFRVYDHLWPREIPPRVARVVARPPTSSKPSRMTQVVDFTRLVQEMAAAERVPYDVDGFASVPSPHESDGRWFSAVEERRAFHASVSHDRTNVRGPLRAFLSTLDPVALAFVETHGNYVGVWEGLDATFAPNAPLRRACEDHPRFRMLLRRAWTHRRRDFGERGDDVAGLITERLVHGSGLPRWLAAAGQDAVRCLGDALPDGRLGSGNDDPVVELLSALRHLPASWLPKGDGWHVALRAQATVVAVDARVPHDEVARVLNVRGRWHEWEARLREAAGGGDVRVDRAFRDARDASRALAAEVATPALRLDAVARGVDPDGVGLRFDDDFRLAYGGLTLRRILELSRAWHARRAAMLAALRSLPDSGRGAPSWGPGLPDHAEGDLSLTVLTDGDQLLAEGSPWPDADGVPGLSHCVGGYSRPCLSGASRIASVRRRHPDGTVERLSTVELSRSGAAWRVRQHRGRSNGDPPAEARGLVASYLGRVTRGELPVAKVDLEVVDRIDVDVGHAGYDASVPGNWERVVEVWGGLLPRRLRDLDPAGWRAAVDALRKDPVTPGR